MEWNEKTFWNIFHCYPKWNFETIFQIIAISFRRKLLKVKFFPTNFDPTMDIVDIFTHQSKFFRICFHDRRKYSLWIGFIFIVIWFEYIYNFILIIRSFDPKLECQFLELGCGLLPTYRINWNVTIKLFRSVGFLLFNYWYFSDNRWVFLANEQFLKLPFGVPAKRMQSWIKKCVRVTILYLILFNLIIVRILQTDSLFENLIEHAVVTITVYIACYFYGVAYLLNRICVELCQKFIANFRADFEQRRIKPSLIKAFWSLYLMISLIKVYLIQFYLVMVGFSFIMMMQHYSIIYMTRFATDKPIYIAIQLSMISKIFAIIYYTAFYGRINDEAINLAKLIYQYLNIDDVYFRNKSILFQKHKVRIN